MRPGCFQVGVARRPGSTPGTRSPVMKRWNAHPDGSCPRPSSGSLKQDRRQVLHRNIGSRRYGTRRTGRPPPRPLRLPSPPHCASPRGPSPLRHPGRTPPPAPQHCTGISQTSHGCRSARGCLGFLWPWREAGMGLHGGRARLGLDPYRPGSLDVFTTNGVSRSRSQSEQIVITVPIHGWRMPQCFSFQAVHDRCLPVLSAVTRSRPARGV